MIILLYRNANTAAVERHKISMERAFCQLCWGMTSSSNLTPINKSVHAIDTLSRYSRIVSAVFIYAFVVNLNFSFSISE
jgi:hypothetical protein